MSRVRGNSGRTLWAAVAALAIGASPMDEVVTQHTATVESLQCFSCRLRVPDHYLDTRRMDQFTGEYTRFGDRVKCVTKSQDATDEYVAAAGVARTFLTRTSGGRKLYSAALTPRRRSSISTCDAWCAGLIHLSCPNTIEFLPLADLVARAKSAALAPADETVSGTHCAKLALTFDCDPKVCKGRWVVDLYLARDHGLLVKKCVYDCTAIQRPAPNPRGRGNRVCPHTVRDPVPEGRPLHHQDRWSVDDDQGCDFRGSQDTG